MTDNDDAAMGTSAGKTATRRSFMLAVAIVLAILTVAAVFVTLVMQGGEAGGLLVPGLIGFLLVTVLGYAAGHINRTGRVAAGGFSQIAIPERVDLTRVVGDRGQATIRLNARAIFEGTHPDVRLKADDMVNFGTNFFATPLAVIRNGFRMSYGFGFLLDRNFGNDVFGPPPESDNNR